MKFCREMRLPLNGALFPKKKLNPSQIMRVTFHYIQKDITVWTHISTRPYSAIRERAFVAPLTMVRYFWELLLMRGVHFVRKGKSCLQTIMKPLTSSDRIRHLYRQQCSKRN